MKIANLRPLLSSVSVALAMTSCTPKPPPGDYDLVAVSVNVHPSIVHVGDRVILDHVVRNEGKDTVPGGTFTVDLYVDGKRTSFDHGTRGLTPGGDIKYGKLAGHFDVQPSAPGNLHYRLVVDEANNVPERNETNNVLEGDIEVLP